MCTIHTSNGLTGLGYCKNKKPKNRVAHSCCRQNHHLSFLGGLLRLLCVLVTSQMEKKHNTLALICPPQTTSMHSHKDPPPPILILILSLTSDSLSFRFGLRWDQASLSGTSAVRTGSGLYGSPTRGAQTASSLS